MKGLQLFATDPTGIIPVSLTDLSIVDDGQPMALPGAVAYTVSTSGQIVPVNIELIRARS